jgi:hypothetical protein
VSISIGSPIAERQIGRTVRDAKRRPADVARQLAPELAFGRLGRFRAGVKYSDPHLDAILMVRLV